MRMNRYNHINSNLRRLLFSSTHVSHYFYKANFKCNYRRVGGSGTTILRIELKEFKVP